MSDMPERIWLDWPGAKHGEPIYTEPPERDTQAGQTEYVRADIVQALTAERDRQYDENAHRIAMQAKAEAERDRLREALGAFVAHYPKGINPDLDAACFAARAALKGETP